MVSRGTRFRKADLHIHTPASKCFLAGERDVTAAQIVQEAVAKGLEIIAVTDHNDISFVERVREEGKRVGVVVLPGIEITTPEAHLLALFEPGYPIRRLNEFLPAIGIFEEHRGKKEALARNLKDVLAEVQKFGGISIAAHANSSNGLLQSGRGQYRIMICSKPELCALEFTDKEDVVNFSAGKVPGYPAKACLCGSDAHALSEMGCRFVYLKTDEVSISSLSQALSDWTVRVRFAWDSIQPCCPRINKLSVNQGFFGGTTFDFHSNLTCFVGGRGTGKSTVIEFLRYCFDDVSSIEEIREDTYGKVNKLLGPGGKIVVEYTDENGEDIVVSREVDEPVCVVDADEDPAVVSQKPVFFSQGEIARIAMNPIAQLDLIDKYLTLSAENREEDKIIQKLDTNRSLLLEEYERQTQLKSEIDDPVTGRTATRVEADRLEKQLQNPIFLEFPKWEHEKVLIDETIEGIRRLDEALVRSFDDVDIDEYLPPALKSDSPNYDLLRPLVELRSTVVLDLNVLKKQASSLSKEWGKHASELLQKWQPLFDREKSQYEAFLAELGDEDVNKAQARFRTLSERLRELERKQGLLNQCAKAIGDLATERHKMIRDLKDIRAARLQKRLSKARAWETRLGSKVRINIRPEGEMQPYISALTSFFKGSYITRKDIERIAGSIQPDQLVAAIRGGQHDWISDEAKVSEEVARKVVQFGQEKELGDLLDLETVKRSDLPEISFEVETGRYKLLNELSVGTKSTVVVLLAMIEGKSPLVIDQPEDSLDTEFIYNQIVSRLRSEKDFRQFIFTSHNANVVVAGETELAYVLSATSERGEVKSSGGIDRPETNRLMLLHLEGGSEAFKLRARKYVEL